MKSALVAIAAAGTVVAGAASPAAAKSLVKIKQALTATAADPDARGDVRFELKSADDGRLRITVKKLARRALYQVVVGGVQVGRIETKGGGGGRIRFRSRPRGSEELLGFDPRGATVVVRDAQGNDVLAGTIDDGPAADPGDVICCVPDDSGPECEDRTEAECAAEGGTVVDAASCLPNPCEGAPNPGVDVVCCLPDDSGPECEDRTEAECALQGGTVVDATSCAPNPCAATPPAEDEIACCKPHGGEPLECEMASAEACAALGGSPSGAASCTPDACG
ncbi:MAG: hypothetical protein AB1689_21725 [Thermodesulfobacteriota bacterium]